MPNLKTTIRQNSKLLVTCIYIAFAIAITQVISSQIQKYFIDNNNPFSAYIMFIVIVVIFGFAIFVLVKISSPFRKFILRMFGVGSEKKNNQIPTTQNQEISGGKKRFSNWEKYAVVVSIIGLVISSVSTAYVANRSFDLTEQSNSIAERSLALQNMQTNYTTTIITNPNQIAYLDEDGHFQNDTTTSCFGWLNGSVTVISPYYGTLNISFINFTVSDEYQFLLPDTANLTHAAPFGEYSKMYDSIPVVTGLNPTVEFSLLIGASMYPDPQKLPTSGIAVTSIGSLLFEAKVDSLTGLIFTNYFNADVFVVIRT